MKNLGYVSVGVFVTGVSTTAQAATASFPMEMSPPSSAALLGAILAMAFLHLILLVALYATRIPAMRMMKLSPQRLAAPGGRESLPRWAREVSANYSHLSEAPPTFYAVALVIVLLGQADAVHITCAWAYVALRYAHSIAQTLTDNIMLRFGLFIASWVMLAIMIIRAGMALISGA